MNEDVFPIQDGDFPDTVDGQNPKQPAGMVLKPYK